MASIAQSLADMRSNELSGRNFSFRKQKNRKMTASGGTSVLLMKWRIFSGHEHLCEHFSDCNRPLKDLS